MRFAFTIAFLIGCGSSKPASAPQPTPAPQPTAAPETAPKSMMTPDQCTQQGGEVRGDIGDGKIACHDGERELGRVPLGIEGSICCAPAAP